MNRCALLVLTVLVATSYGDVFESQSVEQLAMGIGGGRVLKRESRDTTQEEAASLEDLNNLDSTQLGEPNANKAQMPQSPCDDTLLRALYSKNQLSQIEVFYKVTKEKECASYRESMARAERDSADRIENEKAWQKRKQAIVSGIVLGAVCEIVLVILILANGGSVWIGD